jgi:hypothetical protein
MMNADRFTPVDSTRFVVADQLAKAWGCLTKRKVFRYVNGRLSDIPCSGIFRVSVANWFCAYVSLRRANLDVVFN